MIRTRIAGTYLLRSLLLLSVGCSSEPAWRDLDPAALTPGQGQQLAKAKRACQSLGKELKSRLTAAINKDGPAAAIDVCRVAAGEIAASVAKAADLNIGRTSHRLRNPANIPPIWATAAVAKAESKVILRSGPKDELGALLPIPMAGLCVVCHGAEANIPAPVKAALQRHYPDDKATGFAADELRGWFWVEVR